MKNLKLTFFGVAIVSLMFSCQKEEVDSVIGEDQSSRISFSELEKTNLLNLGFDPEETNKVSVELPDKTSEDFYVYKDISYPVSDLNEISQPSIQTENSKLFITPNRAARNRTYTVAFVDFNQNFQRQAAGDLVFLFNDLRSRVQLRQIFINGSQFGSTQADVFVFFTNIPAPNNGAIGMGTFPTSGRPGRFLQLNIPLMRSISTRENLRRILMHEMGHNFGFRHSDFRIVGEPQNGSTAVAGSDRSGRITNSVMISGPGARGNVANIPAFYTGEDRNAYRGAYGSR